MKRKSLKVWQKNQMKNSNTGTLNQVNKSYYPRKATNNK